MPTTASGSNQPLTLSGTAASEGGLSLSANGAYLVVGGYDATTRRHRPTELDGRSCQRERQHQYQHHDLASDRQQHPQRRLRGWHERLGHRTRRGSCTKQRERAWAGRTSIASGNFRESRSRRLPSRRRPPTACSPRRTRRIRCLKFFAGPSDRDRCDEYRSHRDDQRERPRIPMASSFSPIRPRCSSPMPIDGIQEWTLSWRHLVECRHARRILCRLDRRAEWQHRQPVRHHRHCGGKRPGQRQFAGQRHVHIQQWHDRHRHVRGDRPPWPPPLLIMDSLASRSRRKPPASSSPSSPRCRQAPRPAVPVTVTVTAKYTTGPDVGQTDTSYTGTIAFTSSDPQATPRQRVAEQLHVHGGQ